MPKGRIPLFTLQYLRCAAVAGSAVFVADVN